jgi:methionyl-tRNA formyltransferase
MPLRVLFFGTPAFAVPTLTALMESQHQVVGVVSQPDRARGRGQRVSPSPVKVVATQQGLAILQPERLKDEAFLDAMRGLAPDLAVVAAYGRLLPQIALDVPRLGFINVHASLLPRWRGAAPVHRAVLAGDAETGVTIMRMVLALDAGPMLARVTTPIAQDETSEILEARLAALGATLLVATVDRLAGGPVEETRQDEQRVTYAARLERRESAIDWARPAAVVHNQIRGLQPWPLAAASLSGRRVLLLRSAVANQSAAAHPPGTIIGANADGLVVATHPGAIRIVELQPEGRRAMSVRDFLNGTKIVEGDRFVSI